MNKNKLYYFAHPYTVKDDKGNNIHTAEEANFNLCCIRAGRLFEMGYLVYAPIAHTHPIHVRSPEFLKKNEYELWMRFDEKMIEACEGLILAPGWESSSGCKYEKEKFEKKSLEVLLYRNIAGGDV